MKILTLFVKFVFVALVISSDANATATLQDSNGDWDVFCSKVSAGVDSDWNEMSVGCQHVTWDGIPLKTFLLEEPTVSKLTGLCSLETIIIREESGKVLPTVKDCNSVLKAAPVLKSPSERSDVYMSVIQVFAYNISLGLAGWEDGFDETLGVFSSNDLLWSAGAWMPELYGSKMPIAVQESFLKHYPGHYERLIKFNPNNFTKRACDLAVASAGKKNENLFERQQTAVVSFETTIPDACTAEGVVASN